MRIQSSQSGVAHLAALLLVLIVLGVVGFAGYTVWNAGQDKTTTDSTTQPESSAIKTQADLESTGKLLDTTATQLDNDLDVSTLDSDIEQLL
jgi:hypothetical protein